MMSFNQISVNPDRKSILLRMMLWTVWLQLLCGPTTQAANDLKTRSIRPDDFFAAADAPSTNDYPLADEFTDDRIVRVVIAAARQENVWSTIGMPCRSDLNRTFEALRRSEAWAIASELVLFVVVCNVIYTQIILNTGLSASYRRPTSGWKGVSPLNAYLCACS